MKLKQTTLKFGVSDSVKEAKMHDSGLAARVTAALMAQQGRDGGSAGVGTAARLEQDHYETLQCNSGLKAMGEDGVRVETARIASALITHPGKDEVPGLDERGRNGVQEDARRTSGRPRRENGECTPWWIVEGNNCETSGHPPLVESEETTRATRPALANGATNASPGATRESMDDIETKSVARNSRVPSEPEAREVTCAAERDALDGANSEDDATVSDEATVSDDAGRNALLGQQRDEAPEVVSKEKKMKSKKPKNKSAPPASSVPGPKKGAKEGSGSARHKAEQKQKPAAAVIKAVPKVLKQFSPDELRAEISEAYGVYKAAVATATSEGNLDSPYARHVELPLRGLDPMSICERSVRMFWEEDFAWYGATIIAYDEETGKHTVEYDDGEQEQVDIGADRYRIKVLPGEFVGASGEGSDAVAAAVEGSIFPGQPIFAKMRGYPMWPAIMLSEGDGKVLMPGKALKPTEAIILFFGTGETAAVPKKQLLGIERSIADGTLKWTKADLKKKMMPDAASELLSYLKSGAMPDCFRGLKAFEDADNVLTLVTDAETEDADAAEEERASGDEGAQDVSLEKSKFPMQVGQLTVRSLGAVQYIRPEFHTSKYIFPVGYEVQRTARSRLSGWRDRLHSFRILEGDDGVVLCASTLGKNSASAQNSLSRLHADLFEKDGARDKKAGMTPVLKLIGLTHKSIIRLIQQLPNACRCSRYDAWLGEKPAVPPPDDDILRAQEAAAAAKLRLPDGIEPVKVTWPTDRCAVCDTIEEYDDNLLIQCDKCRLTVHQSCYGITKAPEGVWLCNVCRLGLGKPPPCCVCPVQGGPLKPTTDGRFIHIPCMMWIPECSAVNTELMEPISVQKIPKSRFKLVCQVCKIRYGACVQCVEDKKRKKCYAAFHPLCARRQPDYGMEVEYDEVDLSATMKAYCPRHCPVRLKTAQLCPPVAAAADRAREAMANGGGSDDGRFHEITGCSRATALDLGNRRKRQEPEHIAAALKKRKFVKSLPYVVTGRVNEDPLAASTVRVVNPRDYADRVSSARAEKAAGGAASASGPGGGGGGPRMIPDLTFASASASGLLSMAEKFWKMRETLSDRLTNGKSAIHGWGAFTKVRHAAGDMMIEYCGDLVRPGVAEVREDRMYDKLVGAGTYVFRLDKDYCVDATRAGNMAHLINHSCEPNCHSRTITVNGKNHVVIFALCDIGVGVELSYDYRFSNDREKLVCNCGAKKCRGIVNVQYSHNDNNLQEEGLVRARTSEVTPLPTGLAPL